MRTVRWLGGISLLWALSSHADVIQYQGLDGRRYFANAVPATGTVQPLPALRPRLARATARENQQARMMSLVYPLAQQYDIDANLVRAIIEVESNFDAQAVSTAGAQGLMQLMPETATRYQVQQPFDPRANVEGGIRYLKDLWQRFGEICRVCWRPIMPARARWSALAAYHPIRKPGAMSLGYLHCMELIPPLQKSIAIELRKAVYSLQTYRANAPQGAA